MNNYSTAYFNTPDLIQLYNMMYFFEVFKKNEKIGFFEFSKKAEKNIYLDNLKELGIKVSLALDDAESNKLSRTHIVISKKESEIIIQGVIFYRNLLSSQEILSPEKNTKEEIALIRQGISTIIETLTSSSY